MIQKNLLIYFSFFIICGNSANAAESSEFAQKVISEHRLTGSSAAEITRILTQTPNITRNIGTEDANTLQGPHNSWHPASRAQCIAKVIQTGLIRPNPQYEKICGAKWMSPVPDYPGQPLEQVHSCVDQFSFPDIPCEYPMVWTPAPVTQKLCTAMGKRVCNSHEWEGACAGSLDSNDPYRFALPFSQRRDAYNNSREVVFAFQWQTSLTSMRDTRMVCGVYSAGDSDISLPMRANLSAYYTSLGKSLTCQQGPGSDFETCGTNTWPAGFKYMCRSAYDVFDMHGNVAEVVNFPTSPAGLAHNNSSVTDKTERKGSFFVYRGNMYPDDCRVRQPYEHFNSFSSDGMAYYQEGFRCCKDVQ